MATYMYMYVVFMHTRSLIVIYMDRTLLRSYKEWSFEHSLKSNMRFTCSSQNHTWMFVACFRHVRLSCNDWKWTKNDRTYSIAIETGLSHVCITYMYIRVEFTKLKQRHEKSIILRVEIKCECGKKCKQQNSSFGFWFILACIK